MFVNNFVNLFFLNIVPIEYDFLGIENNYILMSSLA